MVAVSATLPNIVDVAEFIGAKEAFAFDESFRPVPLAKHVVALGYVGKNEYRFWNSLDRHVPEIISRFSNGKQTLIFCHTKRETEQVAALLADNNFGGQDKASSNSTGGVHYWVDRGVAYHHAGVQQSERQLVEQAFLAGKIRCLCATSTLAVGVNLPAHLVIVKGTKTWRGGGSGYADIDKGSLLQMMGRAGRPGLDSSGVAVIMTDNQSKSIVEHLIKGLGAAESRMLPKLADVINTEISQGVITSLESAVRWVKTTFLYTRMRQSPKKYAMDDSWHSHDAYIQHILGRALDELFEANLIARDHDGTITPLTASHIMSQSMVALPSMKLIACLAPDATLNQILKSFAQMEALQFNVRRNEKKVLNECHKSESIRFKLEGPLSKVRIQQPWEKSFVLLQAFIGQHSFDNFTLGQEMTTLANNAQRLLLAAQEYSFKGSQYGKVALQCLKLRRSLHFSLWGDASGALNQIDGVGPKITDHLKFHGISTFEHVVQCNDEALERATGKSSPFGKQLKLLVSQILKQKMKVAAEVEYTRGSNTAYNVACHIRFSEAQISSERRQKSGGLTYTLVRTYHYMHRH